MTTRTRRPPHRDSGAALLLAIGFVLMVSLISGGLAALATSGLNNRNSLELLRNRQYAADGAIEKAISEARASASPCLAGGPTLDTLNSIEIRVDWFNACGVVQSADGTMVAQRNVIFSACEGNASQACLDANVIIRAQVNFQQSSPTTAVAKTYVQSWSVNR